MIPFPMMTSAVMKPGPVVKDGISLAGMTYTTNKRVSNSFIEDASGQWWAYGGAGELPGVTNRTLPTWTKIDIGYTKDQLLFAFGLPTSPYLHCVTTSGDYKAYYSAAWNDVTITPSGESTAVPVHITSEGVNVALVADKVYPVGSTSPLNSSYGSAYWRVPVIGSEGIYDIYYGGESTSPYVTGMTSGNKRAVKVLSSVKKFECTLYSAAAILQDGTLWACGANRYQQYGAWTTGSPSTDAGKVSYWQQVPLPSGVTGVTDVGIGAESCIIRDTTGQFWTKGRSVGQMGPSVTTVNSDWVLCTQEIFTGFVEFLPGCAAVLSSEDVFQWRDQYFFWTDAGLKSFGFDNRFLGRDISSGIAASGGYYRTVSSVVGLPTTRPDYISCIDGVALYQDNPSLLYSICGARDYPFPGGYFNGGYSQVKVPAWKTYDINLQFNEKASLARSPSGLFYGTGTPSTLNGMATNTTPGVWIDQKIDTSLIKDFLLSDGASPSLTIRPSGQVLVARADNSSNVYSNGSLWGSLVSSSAQYAVANNIQRGANKIYLKAPISTGAGTWRGFQVDITETTIGTLTDNGTGREYWYTRGGLPVAMYNITAANTGLVTSGMGAQGYNYSQIFNSSQAETYFSLPTSTDKTGGFDWTITHDSMMGLTHPTTFGETPTATMYGRNWGQTGTTDVINRTNTTFAVTNIPNFKRFLRVASTYTGEGESVPQSVFMYEGTDGLIYAAGMNTTGLLGTGSLPATKDEVRRTFEVVSGSNLLSGKNYEVVTGWGGASPILFVTYDGEVYGLGLPSGMTWNDTGTDPAPFFPGFDRRLDSITYLGTLPDALFA